MHDLELFTASGFTYDFNFMLLLSYYIECEFVIWIKLITR
jgi:hypothetical protein